MEGRDERGGETGIGGKRMSARYLLVCAVYLVKINIIVHFKDIKVDFESWTFELLLAKRYCEVPD